MGDSTLEKIQFKSPEEDQAYDFYTNLFEYQSDKPQKRRYKELGISVETYTSPSRVFGVEVKKGNSGFLLDAGLVNPSLYPEIPIISDLNIEQDQRVVTFNIQTKVHNERNHLFWARAFKFSSMNFLERHFGRIDFILAIANKGSDTWNRYAEVYEQNQNPFTAAQDIGDWFMYDKFGFPYPIGIQSMTYGKLSKIKMKADHAKSNSIAKKVLSVGSSISMLYSRYPSATPVFNKVTKRNYY